jgi:SAM-dependent methyltransferase
VNPYVVKNRDLWDEWAEINVRSPFYDVAAFKRAPSPLDDEVLAGLGDLAGTSVLHLQCHFGMDTLRLALAGASRAVGVDFSPKAIAHARALATEMNVGAEFVEADVLALDLGEQFDVVFTSYGVIGWLPELTPWGAVIAKHLKPGGRFFMIEGHPTMWMFDGAGATELVIRYPYFHRPGEPIVIPPATGTYADPEATFEGTEYSWPHDLAETFGALLDAGLRIEQLREYAHTVWQAFPFMIEESPGRFVMPPDKPTIPTMFSIRATR